MTATTTRQRPGQLLAIGIIGLLLGVLGGCVGLSTIGSSLAQGPMQSVQRAQLETQYRDQPEVLERQLQLQETLRTETQRWLPLSVAHQSLNMLASLALLIASVLLFRWHPKAPRLFVGAAYASLAIDLVGVATAIVMQLAMQDAMQSFFTASAAADPNMPAGMGDLMGPLAQASVGASVCMGIGFFGIKCAYYVWGIVFVRKDTTRALFAPPPAPAPSPAV